MKNMKNWMMLMVVGAMVSGSIQASDQTQDASSNNQSKKSPFAVPRLKEMKEKFQSFSKEFVATASTFDGHRLKEMKEKMKEKLQLFQSNIPGMFNNAMKKVKNGKAIEAIKDMKSKMETLLEKARKSEFITDDQAQNIRTKFNDMKEKLKEKLNEFKSSGGNGISEDAINFINQNSENLKNNIKNYLNKAEDKINSMIQG